MLIGKIDVKKIDKKYLFVGSKGTYLDLFFKPTPDSKYGHDYMIIQSIPENDREAGGRGPIIGNAKYLRAKPEKKDEDFNPLNKAEEEDSLPF
jgi:hypothetical protein